MSFKNIRLLVYTLPLVFLALFFVYPLIAILQTSLAPDGVWQLSAPAKLAESSYYARVFWFTWWQAILSTALVLLLAVPASYVFVRYQFRGKESLRTISTLPFVLPTVVVAGAFTALLGPAGLLNRALISLFGLKAPPIDLNHSLTIILLAHIFYNFSVALRMISAGWQNINPAPAQAAMMLGASPLTAFRLVTWPLLRPVVTAAALLVFIFCFTSFGVILILGGPRFATLEVEIYRQTVQLFNLPVAAALSMVQISFTALVMVVYTRLQANVVQSNLKSGLAVSQPVKTWRDRLLVGVTVTLMLTLLGGPLLALLLGSVRGAQGFTLRFYQELFVNRHDSIFFVPPIEAVFNSTAYALLTVLLATLLGLSSALLLTDRRRGLRWLDPIFMLPLATSAVTLGFGFVVALGKPPLNLRSSAFLVPAAHTLVAMPFVIRAVLPALRRINPRQREAAGMLGASPGRVWWHIDLPLIRRALLVGAVFAFTISMGEFGATVFVARPQTPTMSVAIYRFLSQPGALNYGQALAMSVLLMLICALGFMLIERFRLGDEGEF